MHARDVTVDLAKLGITNTNDFNWLSQMRYYIHRDTLDEMYVHLINTEYKYGYEYLGNSGLGSNLFLKRKLKILIEP